MLSNNNSEFEEIIYYNDFINLYNKISIDFLYDTIDKIENDFLSELSKINDKMKNTKDILEVRGLIKLSESLLCKKNDDIYNIYKIILSEKPFNKKLKFAISSKANKKIGNNKIFRLYITDDNDEKILGLLVFVTTEEEAKLKLLSSDINYTRPGDDR